LNIISALNEENFKQRKLVIYRLLIFTILFIPFLTFIITQRLLFEKQNISIIDILLLLSIFGLIYIVFKSYRYLLYLNHPEIHISKFLIQLHNGRKNIKLKYITPYMKNTTMFMVFFVNNEFFSPNIRIDIHQEIIDYYYSNTNNLQYKNKQINGNEKNEIISKIGSNELFEEFQILCLLLKWNSERYFKIMCLLNAALEGKISWNTYFNRLI